MRCILCDRPLTAPAVALEGRNGPRMIGPKCARKAGLIKPKPRIRKAADNVSARSRSAEQCDRTVDWIDEVTA